MAKAVNAMTVKAILARHFPGGNEHISPKLFNLTPTSEKWYVSITFPTLKEYFFNSKVL